MAKEQWERQTALGYGDTPDTYVCAECFPDLAIKEFINENTQKEKCSYCSNESDEPIAAPFDEVVDFICEGINTEWNDPTNCMGWESREGGWQGATVYSSYELVMDEIEELFDTNQNVLDAIALSMPDNEWCQQDPYGLRKEEALAYSWADFSNQVKHKSRYIFLRMVNQEEDQRELDAIPVSKMLDRMSNELLMIDEIVSLTRIIGVNANIFRARLHDKDKKLTTAKDLGTVPLDSSKYSNRMSPAGIPMFYGALEAETAFQEIIDNTKNNAGRIVSIANFYPLRPILVLDLTNLPGIPSIFDQKQNHLRSSLMFLRGFVKELSKPINKDGYEHIEYVPTQIFTEYIRHLFKTDSGDRVEGILYPSSRNPIGVACVLFIENEQCCDRIPEPVAKESIENKRALIKYLVLEKVEVRLFD